jgi:hypothetical protein
MNPQRALRAKPSVVKSSLDKGVIMRKLLVVFGFVLGLSIPHPCNAQSRNVPVPHSCSPQVNSRLQAMIIDRPRGYVENVMVCGIAE